MLIPVVVAPPEPCRLTPYCSLASLLESDGLGEADGEIVGLLVAESGIDEVDADGEGLDDPVGEGAAV